MSKEHSCAYEAGYRDGSIHYELEHCPACKNVADLQEALEENTKLIVKLNAEHIVRQNVEVENAKLRKLAVGMYGMLEMFDTLLGNHDACETPRPLVFGEDKSFKDAMRELGVEVKE